MTTTDQSKSMLSIGLDDISSFDSSTDDDIIPMQSNRRKKKNVLRRNRNNRSSTTLSSSSSSFLKNSYSFGLFTLLKFMFIILIIISIIIGAFILHSLSKRIDSLQISLSQIQSSNPNLPDDLHALHVKFESLEQESKSLRTELNDLRMISSNRTDQNAQIHRKLQQLSQSIQTGSSNISRLTGDVENLKLMINDLNGLSSTFNDSQMIKLENDLQQLKQNFEFLKNNQSIWSSNIEQIMMNLMQNNLFKLNGTLNNLNRPLAQQFNNIKSFESNASAMNHM